MKQAGERGGGDKGRAKEAEREKTHIDRKRERGGGANIEQLLLIALSQSFLPFLFQRSGLRAPSAPRINRSERLAAKDKHRAPVALETSAPARETPRLFLHVCADCVPPPFRYSFPHLSPPTGPPSLLLSRSTETNRPTSVLMWWQQNREGETERHRGR